MVSQSFDFLRPLSRSGPFGLLSCVTLSWVCQVVQDMLSSSSFLSLALVLVPIPVMDMGLVQALVDACVTLVGKVSLVLSLLATLSRLLLMDGSFAGLPFLLCSFFLLFMPCLSNNLL